MSGDGSNNSPDDEDWEEISEEEFNELTDFIDVTDGVPDEEDVGFTDEEKERFDPQSPNFDLHEERERMRNMDTDKLRTAHTDSEGNNPEWVEEVADSIDAYQNRNPTRFYPSDDGYPEDEIPEYEDWDSGEEYDNHDWDSAD